MAISARRIGLGKAVFLIAAQYTTATEAVEISTIGVQSAIEDLVPKFEKASGQKLTITLGYRRP